MEKDNVSTIETAVPLLPILLHLHGKPMTLEQHLPMEPIFRLRDMPPDLLLKCGRQVSKSTALSAILAISHAVIPHLMRLVVSPLKDQVTRLSSDRVFPLIDQSPIRSVLLARRNKDSQQNVLRRAFKNGGIVTFNYASDSADRIRGISSDWIDIDEYQDMLVDHLPVIMETKSATQLFDGIGIVRKYGTPKFIGNIIEQDWQRSSKAEFVIKCPACSYYNMCCLSADLENMTQEKGFCCAKCSEPVHAKQGFWVHTVPSKSNEFAGYHVPQQILPMHHANPNKWRALIQKRDTYDTHKYRNEVCGESDEEQGALITETQLRMCCDISITNKVQEAAKLKQKYRCLYMGIDWGHQAAGVLRHVRGRQVVEDGTPSFTSVSIVGFQFQSQVTPTVIYTERFMAGMTPDDEAARIIHLLKTFRPEIMAHDYGGAGNLREWILSNRTDLPTTIVAPMLYQTSADRNPVVLIPENDSGRGRAYFQIDRTKTLQFLCHLVKKQAITLPSWETAESELRDFLSLFEHVTYSKYGAEKVLINHDARMSDDTVHSINFACLAHWQKYDLWQELSKKFGLSIPNEI